MAKEPVHFMGFLGNVDDSIAKLTWREGFSISRLPASEVDPFLKEIRDRYGEQGMSKIVDGASDLGLPGCYCVRKERVTEYEFPPYMASFPEAKWQEIKQEIEQPIRGLKLLKEGNIVVRSAFLYCGKWSSPTFLIGSHKQYVPDRTRFALNAQGVCDAQSFINEVSLPFKAPFLATGFAAFEQSYEHADQSIVFLLLMIAMEVLLHPGNRDELKYRICRNAGVLLGQDVSTGEAVFGEMRSLYDKRSALVHSGDRSSVARQDVVRLRQYVRETIKEAMRSRLSKDELLKMLNACGFGQRPWREKGK